MNTGVIKVANQDGVYLIKMSGDVRLNLSVVFDDFIQDMLSDPGFRSVVFDLSDAIAVDSTTLGLMAKISLRGRAFGHPDPVMLTQSPGILRLLKSMGFDELLTLEAGIDVSTAAQGLENLQNGGEKEEKIRQTVLEAHRILSSLNEKNEATFRDLLQSLEDQSD